MNSDDREFTCRDASFHRDGYEIADLLVMAFRETPLAKWVCPDPQMRDVVLHTYFHNITRHAFAEGFVDIAKDTDTGRAIAVAIWNSDWKRDPEPIYRTRLAALLPEPARTRVLALDHMLRGFYPPGRWCCLGHLAAHASHPDWRGTGAATALLVRGLKREDNNQEQAFIQVPTADAARYYQQHRFTPLPSYSVSVNGSDDWLEMFPLHRPAREPEQRPTWAHDEECPGRMPCWKNEQRAGQRRDELLNP